MVIRVHLGERQQWLENFRALISMVVSEYKFCKISMRVESTLQVLVATEGVSNFKTKI